MILGAVPILEVAAKHQIVVPFQDPVQFNPTVCVDKKGELRVVLRVMGKAQRTVNFAARVTSDWKLTGPARLITPPKGHANLEDLRLFYWQGQMHAVGASWVPGRSDIGYSQVLLRMSDDGWYIRRARPQKQFVRCEKNWMPCVVGDELKWVYSVEPLVVLPVVDRAVGDDGLKIVAENAPAPSTRVEGEQMHGGSQLIPWQGGWLAVTHRIVQSEPTDFNPLMGAWGPTSRCYPHYFVRFDQGLTQATISKPFFFHAPGIEFCGGLAWWKDNLVAAYGVNDSSAWLAEILPETVSAQF